MGISSNEELRSRYKPNEISILFVGESEPAKGDFFYCSTGPFYTNIRNAVWPHIKRSDVFLTDFKFAGMFLDDLVLEPIDNLSRAQRKSKAENSVQALSDRIKLAAPKMIFSLMLGVAPYVEKAAEASNLNIPVHHLPFPGNGHQNKFKQTLQGILTDIHWY